MPFCPFLEGMGRPPQRGVHQQTMPSLLCFWLLFYDVLSHHVYIFSVCENVPWSRATHTRRDTPYTDMSNQWGMVTQEEMVTQDETTPWRLNSEWPSQRRRSRYFGKKPRLLVNGEVVKSDFVDANWNLILSFPSLHNTPRSLELVNIPARKRGECIDNFKLSVWVSGFKGTSVFFFSSCNKNTCSGNVNTNFFFCKVKYYESYSLCIKFLPVRVLGTPFFFSVRAIRTLVHAMRTPFFF